MRAEAAALAKETYEIPFNQEPTRRVAKGFLGMEERAARYGKEAHGSKQLMDRMRELDMDYQAERIAEGAYDGIEDSMIPYQADQFNDLRAGSLSNRGAMDEARLMKGSLAGLSKALDKAWPEAARRVRITLDQARAHMRTWVYSLHDQDALLGQLGVERWGRVEVRKGMYLDGNGNPITDLYGKPIPIEGKNGLDGLLNTYLRRVDDWERGQLNIRRKEDKLVKLEDRIKESYKDKPHGNDERYWTLEERQEVKNLEDELAFLRSDREGEELIGARKASL